MVAPSGDRIELAMHSGNLVANMSEGQIECNYNISKALKWVLRLMKAEETR